MTYSTSKGRTLTWGQTSGITTDTSSSFSYTSETTFFSKGYDSSSRDLSDYWWVPIECYAPVNTDEFSPDYNPNGTNVVDPTEANGFCDNEGYTPYVSRNEAIYFNDEGCSRTNYQGFRVSSSSPTSSTSIGDFTLNTADPITFTDDSWDRVDN